MVVLAVVVTEIVKFLSIVVDNVVVGASMVSHIHLKINTRLRDFQHEAPILIEKK